jgi:hypothetical protein
MAWRGFATSALAILTLTGCAITPDQAQKMTSYDLCTVIYDHRSNAQSRPIANDELRSRGYDCTRDRDAILTSIQMQLQAGAALGALGAQLLQQSQPQQPIMIQQQSPTNCRIIRSPYGDRVYCN